MKAFFSTGPDVPVRRALTDHRAWLVPLAVVLVANLIVLVAVVMPLSRGVQANERREQAAGQAEVAAARDLQAAKAQREGRAQAMTDLDAFYETILPNDVAAARRITHVRLAQLADEHGVVYERGATSLEQLEASRLAALHVSMSLTGAYGDVRAFLYALERADEFVVIDNMALAEGADAAGRLSLTLDVSTYFPLDGDAR